MAKQHVDVLTALGVSKEQIDHLEGLTEDKLAEFKPDDYVTAVHGNVRKVLENDQAFLNSIPEDKIPESIKKSIEKGQYARFQNEIEDVAIKQLGLNPDFITADDKKSIKAMTKKIAEGYLSKAGNVEGLKEMQAKMAEALQERDKIKTESEATLTKRLEEENGKNTARFIKVLTNAQMAQLDGVKLSVDSQYITDPVLNHLMSKYSVVLDANDNLTLKQKDNSALDVLDSAGKTITFKSALKQATLDMKLGTEITDDDKNEKSRQRVNIDGDNGDVVEGLPDYIKNKMDLSKDK